MLEREGSENMKLKHILPCNKSEKMIQVSQMLLNLSVVLALSPLVYAAIENAYHRASDWPERLRNVVWKYLSGESE